MWTLFVFFSFVSCALAEKVIIIGAGAAGIAAASRLLDHNITDFRILEGENRIGGRIHSFHFGNAVVDLGAEFVHGEKGNLVYELAKDILEPSPDYNGKYVYYSGQHKTGEDLFVTTRDIYLDLGMYYPNSTVSIGEAFLARYNSTILEKYKNDTGMLNYAEDFRRTIECIVNSFEGSFSWFSPTVTSNFVEAEGDQAITWNGLGYKTILDILLKNYPNKTGYDLNNQLSLGKTVTKISLNGSLVDVKCKDGFNYSAEHVIFTPSLGVLKNYHKEIFEPQLSKEKVEAMNLLGIDGVMKIIMKFPTNWWGDEYFFVFVWTEDDKRNLVKEFPDGLMKDGDHWLSWFTIIEAAPNNPTVLIAWILGPLLPEIEKLSELEVKEGSIYVLNKFLGKRFNVTEPSKVIQSKWCTNPHFRGSYSFENALSKVSNITSPHSILLQPITDENGVPRILFAGEATNPTRFSTVDGAIGTGFRESDRLLKIFQKNNN